MCHSFFNSFLNCPVIAAVSVYCLTELHTWALNDLISCAISWLRCDLSLLCLNISASSQILIFILVSLVLKLLPVIKLLKVLKTNCNHMLPLQCRCFASASLRNMRISTFINTLHLDNCWLWSAKWIVWIFSMDLFQSLSPRWRKLSACFSPSAEEVHRLMGLIKQLINALTFLWLALQTQSQRDREQEASFLPC